ncbi:hypothetical protein [Polyangium sorediatum]|uniref:Uncharacterized protein n=1 Tax=Polyangium sorediatum TaxID=889274 RepID=A0ABT6P980_9BACT|nr:hypothetical protein [Polyangium sorediatum]MDI1437088.1 hypothetical protein [Polyangium sorediatum]
MNDAEPTALDGQSSAVEPDPRNGTVRATAQTEPKAPAVALRSWQQIIDLYGGECRYQLIAQCGKTFRYTAESEKLYFSGPARKPVEKRRSKP